MTNRITKNAPHPDSAYAHLPLRGLRLEGKYPTHRWTLTAAEKKLLAARPLKYVKAS